MAVNKGVFTLPRRELLAAHMRSNGDTQGLEANDFTNAVMSGDDDGLISKNQDLVARLLSTTLRITDPRCSRNFIDLKATTQFIKKELKLERGRVDSAISMRDVLKPAWNLASAAHNKAWQGENVEDAKRQTRLNHELPGPSMAVIVPHAEPYPPCVKPFEQMQKVSQPTNANATNSLQVADTTQGHPLRGPLD